MLRFLVGFFGWFTAFFRSRHGLGLELVALRHQVGVLKRKNPRPRLAAWDQASWVFRRCVWSDWAKVLVVVNPETVVRWHRAGFRVYWHGLSQRRNHGGLDPRSAPKFVTSSRAWQRTVPTWGAPRIHGELLKLGFEISEPPYPGAWFEWAIKGTHASSG